LVTLVFKTSKEWFYVNESNEDSSTDKDDFFFTGGGSRIERDTRSAAFMRGTDTVQILGHKHRKKGKLAIKRCLCTSTHFSTISLALVGVVAVGTAGRGETSSSAGAGYTAVRRPRVGVVDSDRARG
jgi:hypothetical protein